MVQAQVVRHQAEILEDQRAEAQVEMQVEAVKINRFNRRKYGFTGLNVIGAILEQSQLFHRGMQLINLKMTLAVQEMNMVYMEDIIMVGMKSSFKYV